VTLDRSQPGIVLELKEAAIYGPAQERNFTLPIEGLNETSNHDFLIIHFEDYEPQNQQSPKQRIWVFLDCVSQGYLTLSSNIFDPYRKEGGLIRAVSLFFLYNLSFGTFNISNFRHFIAHNSNLSFNRFQFHCKSM